MYKLTTEQAMHQDNYLILSYFFVLKVEHKLCVLNVFKKGYTLSNISISRGFYKQNYVFFFVAI